MNYLNGIGEPLPIKIKKLREDAFMPKRVTTGSAAYDCLLPCDMEIKFGRQIFPLGFAMAMPMCLSADCRTRAGYAAKGILAYDDEDNEYRIDADVKLGLVDSDYREEVGLIVNVRDERVKTMKLHFKRKQALGQMNFTFVPNTEMQEVDELDKTERIGGYGKQNGE